MRLRNSFKGADLLEQEQFEFVSRDGSGIAPKIPTAPQSRMRPQVHVKMFGQPDARLHVSYTACMTAARDVRGGDAAHQGPRAGGRLAFAEIAIKINSHGSVENLFVGPVGTVQARPGRAGPLLQALDNRQQSGRRAS